MAKYERSESLEKIAKKVIAENDIFCHLDSECCRIAYQTCDSSKSSNGKTVYADTEKVKDKLKGLLPFDFIITFYEDSLELSDESKEKLMYHELRHIGFEPDTLKFSIVPHDIEDFKDVIEKWGVNWII
ncbi:MAG: hypothetical protein LUE21_08795 [Oscillospiraceae bacterium]|nr:hypothetical protein [Oscillospiraceae bacterium]